MIKPLERQALRAFLISFYVLIENGTILSNALKAGDIHFRDEKSFELEQQLEHQRN